jgi:hypothetical protein
MARLVDAEKRPQDSARPNLVVVQPRNEHLSLHLHSSWALLSSLPSLRFGLLCLCLLLSCLAFSLVSFLDNPLPFISLLPFCKQDLKSEPIRLQGQVEQDRDGGGIR